MFGQMLTKHNLKAKLMYAFKLGDICKKHETKGGIIPVYPQIQHVEQKGKDVHYVFTLPSGVDPQLIYKKKYIFQQIFGEYVEIEGKYREFRLNAYSGAVSLAFPYDYKSIEEYLKGLRIPIYCGYDKHGNPIVFDLVSHPHMIPAGETGSGKSSFLRVVLCTLIQHMDPDNLRIILGDMKRLEFGMFRNVAHVDAVHMNANGVLTAAKQLRKEVDRRGELFDQHEVVHIDEYNALGKGKEPYIIFCIDEAALLAKEKEFMATIEEISAVGRALGIFLFLAMQRPSSDVITGVLKNNCTVRAGFKCSDDINSRVIGVDGCEDLTEPGRMILKTNTIQQVQCPLLEPDDAKNILKRYKVASTYTPPKEIIPEPPQAPAPNEQIWGVLNDERA